MDDEKKSRGLLINELRELRLKCKNLEMSIGEQEKIENELKTSKKKIKLFASSVVHDLKTPLHIIRGLAKHLKKLCQPQFGKELHNLGGMIDKEAERTTALVDQIMLFIETEETPLRVEKIIVNDVISMVKKQFSHHLNARQISWHEPVVEIKVKADHLSLQRIFQNLIGNSLKYGGPNLTKIMIEHKISGQSHIFSVKDDGQGLNRSNPKEIFKTFRRASSSRGVVGSGLGLSIVKEIVEKHGGKVWVELGETKGITFHFSIPESI